MPVHTCVTECTWNGLYICDWGHLSENTPLVEFIYLVLNSTPGGVTVGNKGLCCCVFHLSSATMSFWLVIHFAKSFKHSPAWKTKIHNPIISYPAIGKAAFCLYGSLTWLQICRASCCCCLDHFANSCKEKDSYPRENHILNPIISYPAARTASCVLPAWFTDLFEGLQDFLALREMPCP